jgi:hypothetical protein
MLACRELFPTPEELSVPNPQPKPEPAPIPLTPSDVPAKYPGGPQPEPDQQVTQRGRSPERGSPDETIFDEDEVAR